MVQPKGVKLIREVIIRTSIHENAPQSYILAKKKRKQVTYVLK